MNYDALERMVRLRDQGVLSSEEFAEQKRVLFESDGVDASTPLYAVRHVPAYSILQRIGAAAFMIGLCAVLYSTFVYDTTISPMDASSTYSSVNETSSVNDRVSAISDVTSRFERTMAGERNLSLPRAEEQRQIFSIGAMLMILGAIGFIFPQAQKRR